MQTPPSRRRQPQSPPSLPPPLPPIGRAGRVTRPPAIATEKAASRVGLVAGIVLGLLFLGFVAAWPFRDRLFGALDSRRPAPLTDPADVAVAPPVPQPAVDPRNTPEFRRLEAIKRARQRLLAAAEKWKPDVLRDDAEALAAEIRDIRAGRKDLPFMGRTEKIALVVRGKEGDPLADVERVIAACGGVVALLESLDGKPDGELSAEQLDRVPADLEAAAASLAASRTAVKQLVATELAQREKESTVAEGKRQAEAFRGFMQLVSHVELTGSDKNQPVDLGPFAVEHLVSPRFRLAVPRDTLMGEPFEAEIAAAPEAGPAGPRKWEIRYQRPGVDIDGNPQKPVACAWLVARDGRLFLELPKGTQAAGRLFSLLRRSVILAEAKDPAAGDAPPVVREIRLVKPVRIGPIAIDPLGPRQTATIPQPAGIPSRAAAPGGDEAEYRLPVKSLRVEANLAGEAVDASLPGDPGNEGDPNIVERTIILRPLHDDPKVLSLVLGVTVSLSQATISMEPRLEGTKEKQVEIDTVRRNLIDDRKALDRALQAFERSVEQCPGHDFNQAQTPRGNKQTIDWFGLALNHGIALPGHETRTASFDLFLRERFADAAKALDERRRRGDKDVPDRPAIPGDIAEWYDVCQGAKTATDWREVFTRPIERWAAWYGEKLKAEWEGLAKVFQGVVADRPEIRITAITSLAYDDEGTAYRVPLVEFDPAAKPVSVGKSTGTTGEDAGEPPPEVSGPEVGL